MFRRLLAVQVCSLAATGVATVALGLLAYDLAGPASATVLGTAFAVKMVAYVVVTPLVGAYVDRFPRRLTLMISLAVRAVVVLALPFIDAVWQVYVLVAVLQTAAAIYAPVFQSAIPDLVPDGPKYARAIAAVQFASSAEAVVSPVVAAALLLFFPFGSLFWLTSVVFVVAVAVTLGTRLPNAAPVAADGPRARITAGLRVIARSPRLRAVVAADAVVAAAGAVVLVGTVTVVRDTLGGTDEQVALLLAAHGTGCALAAIAVPRVLDRVPPRPVLLVGAATVSTAVTGAAVLGPVWWVVAVSWVLAGIGTGLVLTPIGVVLRRACDPGELPAVLATRFALSHAWWLLAYPAVGVLTTAGGPRLGWVVASVVALAMTVVAVRAWHSDNTAHVHRRRPAHGHRAVRVIGGWRHAHP